MKHESKAHHLKEAREAKTPTARKHHLEMARKAKRKRGRVEIDERT